MLDSEENAKAGLTSGTYAAMVVIPKNFSAAATSFSKDADQAEQATIQVTTSPVAGVADATLGRVVASEAATMLNQTLTESYLKQIYIGFNDLGDQFVTLADGSGQLADGAEKLSDGIGSAADGTKQLYTGTSKLADGLGAACAKTGACRPARASRPTVLASRRTSTWPGANQLVDQPALSAAQAAWSAGVKQCVRRCPHCQASSAAEVDGEGARPRADARRQHRTAAAQLRRPRCATPTPPVGRPAVAATWASTERAGSPPPPAAEALDAGQGSWPRRVRQRPIRETQRSAATDGRRQAAGRGKQSSPAAPTSSPTACRPWWTASRKLADGSAQLADRGRPAQRRA